MTDVERDREIEFLIHRAPSALGEHGTMGAIVAILKAGAPRGGVPNTDLYTDIQIGWGETREGERRRFVGEIERARRLQAAWSTLSPETQERLLARYATASEWPAGVQAAFGPLSGLALLLAPNPSKLIKACSNSSSETAKAIIEAALKRAQRANLKAHEEWRAALRAQRRALAEAWAQTDPADDEGAPGGRRALAAQ